jgi:hypothetical protein
MLIGCGWLSPRSSCSAKTCNASASAGAMRGKKAAERFCYQNGAPFGSRCSPIKLSDKLIGENDGNLNGHKVYCRVRAWIEQS